MQNKEAHHVLPVFIKKLFFPLNFSNQSSDIHSENHFYPLKSNKNINIVLWQKDLPHS